jgi:hypothetical protein
MNNYIEITQRYKTFNFLYCNVFRTLLPYTAHSFKQFFTLKTTRYRVFFVFVNPTCIL